MRQRVEPKPGQESVWDYPRPPRLERTARRIRVVHGGEVIADTTRAWRVLETSHPPVYYLPPEDVRPEYLVPAASTSTFCEWKGAAVYYDVTVGTDRVPRVAFSYRDPTPSFGPIADHVAFYAGRLDACTVDGEVVRPQPGSFYAGWITDDVVGPFKGEPGTKGW
jgi:uncharacterized protein (DUF427 family)